MTTFENGPAHGVTLMLQRSPYFLRVTYDGKHYDALDQLDDVAKPDEALYLYRITAAPSWCHIRAAKNAAFKSGRYSVAHYEFVETQPAAEIMRHNPAWVGWVEQQTDDQERWAEMLAPALKGPE